MSTSPKQARPTYWDYPRECRVCKQTADTSDLVKYAVRHYAHAECALKKWGAAFFDRLTPWQCGNFPYLIAAKYGVANELQARASLEVA